MNATKEKVQNLAREWAEHCRNLWFDSNLNHHLDHPAYRHLVALGPEALPHIMDCYRADDLPWEFVLQEITGIQFIENPNTYNPTAVKARWLDWWAEQQRDGSKPLQERTASRPS